MLTRMIKVIELESGVRLILERMDTVRSACVGIMCDNGSANERDGEYGVSHFIEHMLFKGTSNRTPFDIVNEIDRTGGEINAFTGKELTCFYVKCIDEHLMKSCEVLVDMIENPLFDEKELEREKLVILEEINMCADDPDDLSLDCLEEDLYAGSSLSHRILGTKESVSSFTAEDLRKYYDEHYTRDSIIVSVAGAFNEEEIIGYFNGCFARLGESRRHDDFGSVHSNKGLRTIEKDIEQAHIAMGIKTVPADDDRRYSLSLLNIILGGGMSSRLFQHIREEKGLAYAVGSTISYNSACGIFMIYAGVAKNRAAEALEAIKVELEKLRSGVTEDEFNSAKEQVKAAFIFGQESVKTRMRTNGRNFLGLGRCMTQEEILEIVNAITIEQVNEAVELISAFEDYSIVNVTGR